MVAWISFITHAVQFHIRSVNASESNIKNLASHFQCWNYNRPERATSCFQTLLIFWPLRQKLLKSLQNKAIVPLITKNALIYHSYILDLEKSLIGNIFATVKTKISLLFSIPHSNSAQTAETITNQMAESFVKKSRLTWINQCIFCDQWNNGFILKSFEKFLS